jgi:hypothetical protein
MEMRSETLKERLTIPKQSHLYHYTNPDGLIGILREKKIWATNIRFLNDTNEVIEATNTAKKILVSKKESITKSSEKNLLQMMLSNLEDLASYFYVCSFSEDDDSLSQWRAYCPSTGGGFALGIPSQQLYDLANEKSWIFVKCIYDEEKKKVIIEEIIESFLNEYKEKVINNGGDTNDLQTRITLNFKQYLLKISGAIKNKAFYNEREWRLISPPKMDEEIKFRRGSSGIIPYCEFALETNECPNFVNYDGQKLRLIVGPTPQDDSESRQSAQLILKTLLKVESGEMLSEIPYKGW